MPTMRFRPYRSGRRRPPNYRQIRLHRIRMPRSAAPRNPQPLQVTFSTLRPESGNRRDGTFPKRLLVVDEWVGRTLPDVLLAVSKSLPYLLASAGGRCRSRLNLLKNEDIIITDDERFARQYGVRSPDLLERNHYDTSFARTADAPAIGGRPRGAARMVRHTRRCPADLHTNLHGFTRTTIPTTGTG